MLRLALAVHSHVEAFSEEVVVICVDVAHMLEILFVA